MAIPSGARGGASRCLLVQRYRYLSTILDFGFIGFRKKVTTGFRFYRAGRASLSSQAFSAERLNFQGPPGLL